MQYVIVVASMIPAECSHKAGSYKCPTALIPHPSFSLLFAPAPVCLVSPTHIHTRNRRTPPYEKQKIEKVDPFAQCWRRRNGPCHLRCGVCFLWDHDWSHSSLACSTCYPSFFSSERRCPPFPSRQAKRRRCRPRAHAGENTGMCCVGNRVDGCNVADRQRQHNITRLRQYVGDAPKESLR
ncbi:hypothetical protein BHE74_00034136 [Ensete ventricosum]|nr:hypothetical protein BHE74_00034136 [Ensete ventricosum]